MTRSFMQYQDFKVDFSNVLVIYINRRVFKYFLEEGDIFVELQQNFGILGGKIFRAFFRNIFKTIF